MKLHLIVLGGLLGSCATLPSQGRVTQDLGGGDAMVALGPDVVAPGDRVALYEERCRAGKASLDSRCTKHRIGEGVVKKNLDARSSVISVDRGFSKVNAFVEREVAH